MKKIVARSTLFLSQYWSNFPEIIKAGLIIFFVMMIAYFPIFFQGKTFFFADNYSLLVPQKLWVANQLKTGVIPFWNPDILSGYPAWADTSYTIFYPTTLLFMFASPHIAVNISILLHLFAGSLGVYCVSKTLFNKNNHAIISSLIFLTSQSVTALTNNMVLLQTLSWTPWIALLTIKWSKSPRPIYAWSLPPIVFLSFLSGHPQPLLYMLILMAAYVLFHPAKRVKKFVSHFISPILLTIGMTAIFSFPFFELAQLSTRAHMTVEDVLFGSLNPLYLLQWFLPNVFSHPAAGMAWGPDWTYMSSVVGYITLAGLLFFCFFTLKAKKAYSQKFFLISGLLSLLLSFAKHLPGAYLIAERIPLLTLLRGPALLLLIWVFSASLLLPQAISFTHQKLRLKHHTPLFILLVTWAVAGISWGIRSEWFSQAWHALDQIVGGRISASPFHTLERDFVIVSLVGRQALLTGGLFLLQLYLVLYRKKLSFFLVGVVLILDLILAAKPMMLFAKNSVYKLQTETADWVKQHSSDQYRILSLGGVIPYTGFPSYWHDVVHQPPFSQTRYTPEERETYRELLMRQQVLTPNWHLPHRISSPDGYSTFVLAETASYWDNKGQDSYINSVNHPPLADPRWSDQGVKYFLFNKLLFNTPPSYLKSFPIVHEQDDWLVLENPSAQPIATSSTALAHILKFKKSGNSLSLTTSSEQAATISIKQAHYPGWSCQVNKQTCRVKSGELSMEIDLPPGENQVILRFQPSHWHLLLSVTTLSWLTYVVYFSFLLKRNKSATSSTILS